MIADATPSPIADHREMIYNSRNLAGTSGDIPFPFEHTVWVGAHTCIGTPRVVVNNSSIGKGIIPLYCTPVVWQACSS